MYKICYYIAQHVVVNISHVSQMYNISQSKEMIIKVCNQEFMCGLHYVKLSRVCCVCESFKVRVLLIYEPVLRVTVKNI